MVHHSVEVGGPRSANGERLVNAHTANGNRVHLDIVNHDWEKGKQKVSGLYENVRTFRSVNI